jgi:sulfate transport system substrate-binding protein
MKKIILYAAVALSLGAAPVNAQEPKEILNVSYDIARELYEQVNKAFIADWKAKTGEDLTVN